MNIYNKKEETERLEDFIKNEKESLKARKFVRYTHDYYYYFLERIYTFILLNTYIQYFENDWTMVNQFIKEVEGDANEA